MMRLSIISSIFVSFILASCSSNDDPDYRVFMQPSLIQSDDENGNNQTFEYDDYGRIVSWSSIANDPQHYSSYSAHYFYPDQNTIKVVSEESWLHQQRKFEETIQLDNGRASRSEGTFIYSEYGNVQARKTYRLIFTYLPSNHLNTVEHLEVFGIGDEIKENTWDNAYKWMNYLIWENGNLGEFQDFQGSEKLSLSTKFDYFDCNVSYPIIIPMVISSPHHQPLSMQGVFGQNSVNLIKSATSFDNKGNHVLSREYEYEFKDSHISQFTESMSGFSSLSNTVTYKVLWTER